jgi:hypothetical protein
MGKLSRPLKIPLDKGIHDKENTQDTPLGSLKYARNCEYRGLSQGLAVRKGRSDLNPIVLPEPCTGVVQFEQTIPGGVSEILASTNSGTFQGPTGSQTIFTPIDNDDFQTSPGRRIFGYYDNYQFISNGVDPVMVYNGESVRYAGIPNDNSNSLIVTGLAGEGNIEAKFGLHYTYRYWDSVNNVYSDPPINDGGRLLYVTLDPGSYESITLQGIPQNVPSGTEATHVILYSTQDERVPAAFYPIRWIALVPTGELAEVEVYQPRQWETSTADNILTGFKDPEGVADESIDSGADTFTYYQRGVPEHDVGEEYFDFAPPGSTNDWLLKVILWAPPHTGFKGVFAPATTNRLLIEYSINGGASYDYTLYDDTINGNLSRPRGERVEASSGDGLIGIDISQLRVRIRNIWIPDVSPYYTRNVGWQIWDLRATSAAQSDASLNFFTVPTGQERPAITGFNIGQFQPPPIRIFPTIYDGHLLGVSEINGLYLAYSRVDEPEHWSTNPTFSLFPYLIPFKEKEIDKIVGAERSGVYLVILANDSVWRIDKLPVITAPEGQSNTVFAEARLGARERVTDTVGCVGLRAYTRVQLSSEVDMVFFWSRIGPILTDGHRVWRAADHVRWDFLHEDLSETVVENDIDNRRLLVSLRTKDASTNDLLYAFHYDQGHLLKGDYGIRFKVTGPWDGYIQDMALVKLADTTHVVVGTSAETTGPEAGQLYVFGQQDIDSDTGLVPRFNWVSSNIGMQGKQTKYFDVVFSVQEAGETTLQYGDSVRTPDQPVDKSVIDINQDADDIEITWDNDAVTIRCRMEKEEVVIAGEGGQTVPFTTSDRVVNNMSLTIAPGSFVDE